MRFPLINFSSLLAYVAALAAIAGIGQLRAAESSPLSTASVRPLFEKHCFACHGDGAEEGEMAIDQVLADSNRGATHHRYLAIWKNLRAQLMPPSTEEQPSPAERDQLIEWIERDVFQLDPANPDPGRVTIRRLNREEYRRTIHDLLGVDFQVRDAFPADDTGYGFDTIGDVLSLSPILMEKYLEAAEEIVSQAVTSEGPRNPGSTIWAERFADRRGDGPAKWDPPASDEERKPFAREILRPFAERAFRRPVEDEMLDRLTAMALAVDQQPDTPFGDGIAHAMKAVLVSPRFLFRAEIQPEPNNRGRIVPLDEFALASRMSYFLWSSAPDKELFELARTGKLRENLRPQIDRMLDDEKADRFVRNFVGQWLQTRDVQTVAIDPRRVLGFRSRVDVGQLFNDRVRRSMREETELLFVHLVKENQSVLDLLTANYTFLNEPLAQFYGIDGVEGQEMRKVDLPEDSNRGGVLTHASFLIVTSNPTRTSPVKRGMFILDNLLGTPAPPPPGNVPPLEETRTRGSALTMREAMARHREDALCASCHARMDPLGLAMEEFNALGMWRSEEFGKPIDTAGRLITGESFENTRDLARVISEDRRRDFYRCLTEKMLTYAIGRGVEYYDSPTIERIVDELDKDRGQMRTLIYGVVESAPFQKRRGDGK
jgi:mono/diheme cytochrome c family protein